MNKVLLTTLVEKRYAGERFIWLDWFAYGQRVILNGGAIPWQDSVKLINFMEQGQGLLDLEVMALPLEAYFNWWLANNSTALQDMSGKRRVGYALKTFLANEGLRGQLLELVQNASSALRAPLVLSIPSPRTLLLWAHSTANELDIASVEIEEAMVDNAAVYLADFLRVFATTELAGILITEPPGADLISDQLALYQPIINIADAYHWTVGVHSADSAAATSTSLDFMISDNPEACPVVLKPLGRELWNGDASAEAGMIYSTVPGDANPEAVLTTLKQS